MNLNKEIINWIEYTICEKSMVIYSKSNSPCSTYRTWCERLRNSIVKGDLSNFETRILHSLMVNTNREYCLPKSVIEEICANFYVDRKWEKYIKPITLMQEVKWKLPDPRFKYF